MKLRLIYLSVLLSLVTGCISSQTTQSNYPAITKEQIVATTGLSSRNKLIVNKVIIPGNHKLAKKLLDTIKLDINFSCAFDEPSATNYRMCNSRVEVYDPFSSRVKTGKISKLRPLIFAITNNDVEMVKILIKGKFSKGPITGLMSFVNAITNYDYFAGRYAGLKINKLIYDLYYTTENGKYKNKPMDRATFRSTVDAFDKKIPVLVQNPHIEVLKFWLDKGVDVIDYSGNKSGVTRPNDKMDIQLIEQSYAYHHIRKLLKAQDIERLNLLIQYSDELRKVIPAIRIFAQLNNLYKVDSELSKYSGTQLASDNPMNVNPEYTDVRTAVKLSLLNNNMDEFLNFSGKLSAKDDGIEKFGKNLTDLCFRGSKMNQETCQQLLSRPFMKPVVDYLLTDQTEAYRQNIMGYGSLGLFKALVELGFNFEGKWINSIIKNSKDSDLDYVKYLFSIGLKIDKFLYKAITRRNFPNDSLSFGESMHSQFDYDHFYEFKGSNKVKSYLSSHEFIRDIEDYKFNKELPQLYASNNEVALIAYLVKNQAAMRLIEDEQLKEKVEVRMTQLIGPETYNIEKISQIIDQGATNYEIIQHLQGKNFKYCSKFTTKQKQHLQSFGLGIQLVQAIEVHTENVKSQEALERKLARLEEERLEAINEAEKVRQEQIEQAESEKSNNNGWLGKVAAIGMGAVIANSSSLDSASKAEFLTSYSTDVMNNDMSMSNTEQWKDKTIQQNQQRNVVPAAQNDYYQKLEEVRARKMRVVAEKKETYICYTSHYSKVMASSAPKLKLVAKVLSDHCLFSHFTNSTECKSAPGEAVIYRESQLTNQCDDKIYFDSINKVYQNIIDEHKRTAMDSNYKSNEKLIRLN